MFILVWVVSAFFVKPTMERQSWIGRLGFRFWAETSPIGNLAEIWDQGHPASPESGNMRWIEMLERDAPMDRPAPQRTSER